MPETAVSVSASPPGLWLSISEVARRKGVTPQTIHERVGRLVREQKLTVLPGKGRERLIDLAAYDLAVGGTTDIAKAQAAATVRELASPGALSSVAGTLTDAQRQKAMYDAGLLALEYAQKIGAVIPVDGEHGLIAALRAVGEVFGQEIGRLQEIAAEAVAVAEKDGVIGMRALLRRKQHEIAASVAKALTQLASRGHASEQAGGVTVDLPTPDEETTL